ncbi:MAG: dihydrolipoyl dehydrogenase family protein [Chthoniobacterales bacterium]
MKNYDFVILGGGSAGYAAARTAADEGLKTAVVEGGKELGGLCILRGCMPSKTLLESANRFRELQAAPLFGLQAKDISYDAVAIQNRKRILIKEFADYRAEQLRSGSFDLLRGQARFLSQNEIEIHGPDSKNEKITAQSFLIATGSTINVPKIPGLDLQGIRTSDDLLNTEFIPDSAIVLGAGPVALEGAYFLNALGCKVTLLQRSNRILKSVDPDVSTALLHALEKQGMKIFVDAALQKVEHFEEKWQITYRHEGQNKTVQADFVLNALGRKPNTESLNPSAASVKIAPGGQLETLETQQTSCPHIFAAGDVCGPHEVVHIAVAQGEIAARNAARILRRRTDALEKTDYRLKLFATFTEPQVATVGLSEAEAEAAGIPFFSACYPFDDHGKSLVLGEEEGFVKLLARQDSGEIIGASVIGPEASELIHEVVVAMNFRAGVSQFAAIPHYHPTLSEIWTYPAEEIAEKVVAANSQG